MLSVQNFSYSYISTCLCASRKQHYWHCFSYLGVPQFWNASHAMTLMHQQTSVGQTFHEKIFTRPQTDATDAPKIEIMYLFSKWASSTGTFAEGEREIQYCCCSSDGCCVWDFIVIRE